MPLALLAITSAVGGYFVAGTNLFKKDGTGAVTIDTKGKDLTVNPVVALAALGAAAYFLTKKK